MAPNVPFGLLRPWLDELPRGLVVFGVDGAALYANARGLRCLGQDVLQHAISELPGVLASQGFQPDPARAPRFARGEEVLELTLEGLPEGGTLAWLDDVGSNVERRLKFLSVASHDLRGALANARSFGALLLHPKWNLDSKVRHGLEVMVRNLDRAMGLSNEIFDSMRAELLPLDVDIQDQPLTPLFEGAIERARRSASEQEIGIETDLPRDLPSWPTDAARLSHALDAVLDHALSRTQPHGVCRLRVAVAEDSLLMTLEDEGIAPEAPESLFDRDVRVEQTVKLDAGFRLSLARAELVAIGGSLEADQLPGGALLLRATLNRAAATALAGPPSF